MCRSAATGCSEGVGWAAIPKSATRARTWSVRLAVQRPEGVTVAEWVGQGERDPGVVRQRLDALVAASLLVYDPASTRYGVLFWA